MTSLAGLYLSTLFADAIVELQQKTVAVVGAGTLGSLILDDLAAAGVGAVRVLDHRTDADGLPLAGRLSRSAWESGQSAVTAIDARHEDPSAPGVVEALLDSCDAGVVAWEAFSPSLFHRVNEAALRVGVPWTLVFVDAAEVVVGPTAVPGETACYLEYEIQMEASLTQPDACDLSKDQLEEAPSAQPQYVAPPYAKVGAGLASACILRHLASGVSPVVNRVLRVDLERIAVDSQEMLRLPRCPACGSQRPAYRSPT